jgi:hypothetical protein
MCEDLCFFYIQFAFNLLHVLYKRRLASKEEETVLLAGALKKPSLTSPNQ